MVFDNKILKIIKKKSITQNYFPSKQCMVHRVNKFELLLILNALCQDELKPGG